MENKRKSLDYLWIVLKGMAMGAADVVPGVSGGTIAFISGIYQELVETISKLRPSLLLVLKNQGLKAFWKASNASFLLALVSGIGLSIASLAQGISWLLSNQPILVWSFFFGLMLASCWHIYRSIGQWKKALYLWLILGTLIAGSLNFLPEGAANSSLSYLFISGALASIAMILPGISGAFILVLLGSYATVLTGVHERDLAVVSVVGLGAITGLLSFSSLLKWMLSRYQHQTLAVLVGFMLGALPKIWPWKYPTDQAIDVVAPWNFPLQSQWLPAICLMFAGIFLILGLERWAQKPAAQ
jgi:putative membrane protein